jgi:hypothetical protein
MDIIDDNIDQGRIKETEMILDRIMKLQIQILNQEIQGLVDEGTKNDDELESLWSPTTHKIPNVPPEKDTTSQIKEEIYAK